MSIGSVWIARTECCCYLRNVQDLLADVQTLYERRFNSLLDGPIIPLGAELQKSIQDHQLAKVECISSVPKSFLPGDFLQPSSEKKAHLRPSTHGEKYIKKFDDPANNFKPQSEDEHDHRALQPTSTPSVLLAVIQPNHRCLFLQLSLACNE